MSPDKLALIFSGIALAVAFGSAIFTGVQTKLAWSEQKAKLRPQIYVGTIRQIYKTERTVFELQISNCGLTPGKIVREFIIIRTSDGQQSPDKSENKMSRIVMPNQITWFPLIADTKVMGDVMARRIKLYIDCKIDYQGGGRQYYFEVHLVFDPSAKTFAYESADAN